MALDFTEMLAQRVVMAEREPGKHRTVVDLRTLHVPRWIDEPPPGVAWEPNGSCRSAIHRADLRTAVQMSRLLADEDRVEETEGWGRLRYSRT